MSQAILFAHQFQLHSDLPVSNHDETCTELDKKLADILFLQIKKSISKKEHVQREWIQWLVDLIAKQQSQLGQFTLNIEDAFTKQLLIYTHDLCAFQQSDYFCDCVRLLVYAMSLNPSFTVTLLSEHGQTASSVGQGLILILNNYQYDDSQNAVYVTFVLDILATIFNTKSLEDYFYVNDLKVLLDILLRHLHDLPEFHLLRNRLLQCLSSLILTNQLDHQYKYQQVQQCLRDQSHHAKSTVQQLEQSLGRNMSSDQKFQLDFARTTLRLVQKILTSSR